MRDVYIIGTGMTRFAKHLARSEKDLAATAVKRTLKDAGIYGKDVQSAVFSNSMWGYFTEQHCIRGQVALRPLGITGIPITNVENACASGSTALHTAWLQVTSGQHDCVLAAGVEKLYNEDKLKTFRAYNAGVDVAGIKEHFADWQKVLDTIELEIPEDQNNAEGSGSSRSAFMDVYAGWCRWHMAPWHHPAPVGSDCFQKSFSQFNEPLCTISKRDECRTDSCRQIGDLSVNRTHVRTGRGWWSRCHCLLRRLFKENGSIKAGKNQGICSWVRYKPAY